MAEIYKARLGGIDGFEKTLCVKKILPHHAKNKAYIDMLITEAKLSSILQHANVVQIFELGEIDHCYYISMEFVEGCDLLSLLTACTQRQRSLPVEHALFILAEASKGLAYAHAATDKTGRPLHIIHRDVSPSNVLISKEGDVKVMDFGVARADMEATEANKKERGGLKGKLGYMSPELVTGEEIDHRSDIFALGIVLWETLSLRRLFLGKTDVQTLINIRDVKVEKKFARHPEIDVGVYQIINKALAKSPTDRFQTATEFHDAILDYLFENRLRVTQRHLAQFIREVLPDGELPEPAPPAPPPEPIRVPVAENWLGGERVEPVRPAVPPPLPQTTEPIPPARTQPPPAGAPDLRASTFRVRSEDAGAFGPITINNLMTLLRTRGVTPWEEVSIDGATWETIANSAVGQLVPGLLEEETEQPLYEGPVSRLRVPQLMYELCIQRAVGKLKLLQGSILKEVYFQNGMPVHLNSNIKSELLASVMLQRNMLQPKTLQAALAYTKERGGKLGDALVSMGLLKPHDLYRVLELQFRQRFLEVFTWRSGWYEFYEGHPAPSDTIPINDDAVQLLMGAVRAQYDLATLKEIFHAHLDRILVLQQNPHITHHNLRLNSRELRIYTYLETGITLRETLERFGKSANDYVSILQVVFVLHQTDLLAFRERKHAPPR
jgi:serine/threonine-protein kinase